MNLSPRSSFCFTSSTLVSLTRDLASSTIFRKRGACCITPPFRSLVTRFLLCKRAILGILVLSQSHEHRRSELEATLIRFVRPLRKFYFCHPHWLHPVHFSWLDRSGKRIFVALFQHLGNLPECHLIESRARISHMNQLFFLVVQTQHQRSKILPRSFRIGIPSDHAVHGLGDLDLQPFMASALLVTAVTLFRDDSLQSFLLSGVEQRHALPGVVVGIAHDISVLEHLAQDPLSIIKIHPPQIVAFEVKDVEREIKNRQLAPRCGLPPMRTYSGPLLHQAERGPSLLIQHHNLSVEDRRLRTHELRQIL